jgi:hypothetical protein
MSGPGVSARTIDAAAKAARTGREGTKAESINDL